VTDIRMPGGDGVTLAKEVLELNAEHPVISMITGFADISNFEAYDLGVEGFFTKPFNLEIIREAVSRHLEDPKNRWAKLPASIDRKNIDIQFVSLDQAIEKQLFSIGRGGFFLAVERGTFRIQDTVQFHLQCSQGPSLKGTGIIRWIRPEVNGELPQGIGIEILSLNDDSSGYVCSWIQKNRPKSFIPARSAANS
jgi:Tfp pilus assembly protein PilZ